MPDLAPVARLRTNTSKSLFLREAAAVVGHSLPILLSEALIVVVLVNVEQGRAFLLLENSVSLLYLMTFSAIIATLFSRVLAERVEPSNANDPNQVDRLKWLALWCGSIFTGLVSGFLPAGLIEAFVSTKSCELPQTLIGSYRGTAAMVNRAYRQICKPVKVVARDSACFRRERHLAVRIPGTR